jgi:hypothetical protein
MFRINEKSKRRFLSAIFLIGIWAANLLLVFIRLPIMLYEKVARRSTRIDSAEPADSHSPQLEKTFSDEGKAIIPASTISTFPQT